jgi:hypothetical protein
VFVWVGVGVGAVSGGGSWLRLEDCELAGFALLCALAHALEKAWGWYSSTTDCYPG